MLTDLVVDSIRRIKDLFLGGLVEHIFLEYNNEWVNSFSMMKVRVALKYNWVGGGGDFASLTRRCFFKVCWL